MRKKLRGRVSGISDDAEMAYLHSEKETSSVIT